MRYSSGYSSDVGKPKWLFIRPFMVRLETTLDTLTSDKTLLVLLLVEFFLNRTLNRLWVFAPPTPATYAAFLAIQYVGYVALLSMLALSFVVLGRYGDRALALLALGTFALDTASLAVPIPVRPLPLLLIYTAVRHWSRDVTAPVMALYAAYMVDELYIPQASLPAALYEAAWALIPLARLADPLRPWGVLVAVPLLALVLYQPYYTSMVLVFGMSLHSPVLLPLATYTYWAARGDWRRFVPLLVGPYPQLSVHVLYLVAAHVHSRR